MITQLIPYTDNSVELEGFVVYKSKEKRPLVLLCHAWGGKDDFICNYASHIASLGYVGFAIDMYGKGILGQTKEENSALKKPFLEDRIKLKKRVKKGLAAALSLPFVDETQVAAMGFGFGAICALDLARSEQNLDAAISFYGHFEPPNFSHQIRSKILILHGAKDPISTLEDLYRFQNELDRDGVDWQSHIYSNTFHSFTNPSSQDPSHGICYNALSAKRAMRTAESFIKELFS